MMTLSNHYPSLANKTVVVTGGGSGIGGCSVEHFYAQGAHVYFCDIDGETSKALVENLTATCPYHKGGSVQFTRVDVRDINALKQFIHAVGQQRGTIDVLVNNVAQDDRHTLADMSPEYWDERLHINLRPHVFAIQTAVEYMKNGGSIINMGSVSWMRRAAGFVGYSTAKGAINAMTRTVAQELGTKHIRVNCVVPGAVVTERQKTLWLTPQLEQSFLDNQALKFRIYPKDVVAMILFLAADDSRAMTGQNFIVDAGIV